MQSRQKWEEQMSLLADLDLSRSFMSDAQRTNMPSEEQIRQILAQTNKHGPKDELNCRACGYRSCREKALAVYRGLAEVEMCLPYLIEQLQTTVQQLHKSNEEIQDKQTKLVRSERLAFMGRLAAGIAHEVNNPLGTILIFSHLLRNAVHERDDLQEDAELILREATRCKNIVGGLLDFARQNQVVRTMVELGELLRESVSLVESQIRDERFRIRIEAEPGMPLIALDHDQMVQVVTNLVRNAVDAMPSGGEILAHAWLDRSKDQFRLRVKDSGTGIAPAHMAKLFTPFFTTKPVGKGTGLGLSICYGIVRAHQGTIVAKNNEEGAGASFEIVLPRSYDDRNFQALLDDETTTKA
jgi:signal transduction histidine kinase